MDYSLRLEHSTENSQILYRGNILLMSVKQELFIFSSNINQMVIYIRRGLYSARQSLAD